MRFFSTLITSAIIGLSSIWVWMNYPETRAWVEDILNTSKFQTLEIRHTAESIMESHRKELLESKDHVFLEPKLKFYPYLLLEVKYLRSENITGEGVILWSLVDGEMVLNTDNWEKTHGFTDCIRASANHNEFKIINALASQGGILDREGLSIILKVENHTLDTWIDSCRKKSLIVQHGNTYRLHFQDPKLQVIPETKTNQFAVTKSNKRTNRISRRYRSSQIESIAKAAFGNDFAIRKSTEIYLPIYTIVIQNPDGSQSTTYWNALNGKRITKPYYID